MKIRYKVSHVFTTYPHADVAVAADLHASKMVNHPLFTNPPFTSADISAQNQIFRDKMAAATGDPEDTAAMKTAREVVLDSMRANASYVESLASDSKENILSAGFIPVSKNQAQSPLDQPVILKFTNLQPTQLLLRLKSIANARVIQLQVSTDGGKTWQEALIFTQPRRIVLKDLVSASTVMVRARAVGGSTGYSPWCTSGSIVVT